MAASNSSAFPFTNVLILAPHTDDAELSCGGTIARLIEEGLRVTCLTLSVAHVTNGAHKDAPFTECKKALSILGIPEENQLQRLHEVRRFNEVRQEILDELIQVRDSVQPDVVLLPAPMDIHQDHHVVAQEGMRAFKHVTQLGYEQPWNNNTFQTNFFMEITERQLEKKVAAVACYKSQVGRNFMNDAFLRSLARVRGVQIRKTYAESFQVIRWIM